MLDLLKTLTCQQWPNRGRSDDNGTTGTRNRSLLHRYNHPQLPYAYCNGYQNQWPTRWSGIIEEQHVPITTLTPLMVYCYKHDSSDSSFLYMFAVCGIQIKKNRLHKKCFNWIPFSLSRPTTSLHTQDLCWYHLYLTLLSCDGQNHLWLAESRWFSLSLSLSLSLSPSPPLSLSPSLLPSFLSLPLSFFSFNEI